MTMDVKALQTALGVVADGAFGPHSRAALLGAFGNPFAAAVTPSAIDTYAAMLGCTAKQLNAVAAVESSGGGFDAQGRPKMLFERHLFHRLTDGRWSVCSYSNPSGGGYDENSWQKLLGACTRDPDAAFGSASWGRFQILGLHWRALGYASAFDMAHSMVASEAAHFEALARFIEHNGLKAALASLSTNPADNVGFAKGFNGPGFRQFHYDTKLAAAMR